MRNNKAVDPLEELRLQQNLVQYLDLNGHLNDVIHAGRMYVNAVKSLRENGMLGLPLVLKIEFDIPLVCHVSGELGSFICQHPASAERMLRQMIVFILQETASDLPGGLSLEHVHTPLQVSCLRKQCQILPCRQQENGGLIFIQGVISAITTKTTFTHSCVISCPTSMCPGAARRRVTGGLVRGQCCLMCGTEEQEVPGEREVYEQVLASVLPRGCLTLSSSNRVKNATKVIFRGDMIKGLQLGVCYQVVCRPVRPVHGCYLLACSRPHEWKTSGLVRACQLGKFNLPPKLQQMYNTLGKDSPWAFVWALAMQLGHKVIPNNTFLHLRLITLLSMASHGSSYPVPLFVYGSEHTMAGRLLLAAGSLSSRCVQHSCQDVMGGLARKGDTEADNMVWIDGGSVLLASQGVCYLGDWQAIKKEAKTNVLTYIESGQVTVQQCGQSQNFQLKSVIWTHCARLPQKLLRPLIDVFGLPCLAETTEPEEQKLCDWLLENSAQECQPEVNDAIKDTIPDCEIQELLSVVEMRGVILSEKAGRLIREYFVASRRARASGGTGVEECLPIGAIQTMTSLAEAHARLSLHAEVTTADAVAVIALYEQTLVAMFGPAFMSPPPAPTLLDLNIPLDLQVDNYLDAFGSWLQRYTEALLLGNSEE